MIATILEVTFYQKYIFIAVGLTKKLIGQTSQKNLNAYFIFLVLNKSKVYY